MSGGIAQGSDVEHDEKEVTKEDGGKRKNSEVVDPCHLGVIPKRRAAVQATKKIKIHLAHLEDAPSMTCKGSCVESDKLDHSQPLGKLSSPNVARLPKHVRAEMYFYIQTL